MEKVVYRPIETGFWRDPEVITWSPEDKYFYLYLTTNERTALCGIYAIHPREISLATGYTEDTVKSLLERFQRYGKIIFNPKTYEIAIMNWLRYHPFQNPNMRKGAAKELNDIKDKELTLFVNGLKTELKRYVEETLFELETVEQEELANPLETVSKPLDNPLGTGGGGVLGLVREGGGSNTSLTQVKSGASQVKANTLPPASMIDKINEEGRAFHKNFEVNPETQKLITRLCQKAGLEKTYRVWRNFLAIKDNSGRSKASKLNITSVATLDLIQYLKEYELNLKLEGKTVYAKSVLKRNPVCKCGEAATITDHKTPLDVMKKLNIGETYHDEEYQPMCVRCNTRKGMKEDRETRENYGFEPGPEHTGRGD